MTIHFLLTSVLAVEQRTIEAFWIYPCSNTENCPRISKWDCANCMRVQSESIACVIHAPCPKFAELINGKRVCTTLRFNLTWHFRIHRTAVTFAFEKAVIAILHGDRVVNAERRISWPLVCVRACLKLERRRFLSLWTTDWELVRAEYLWVVEFNAIASYI